MKAPTRGALLNRAAIRKGILRRVSRDTRASGTLSFPAVPALAGYYAQILRRMITTAGRPFSDADVEKARVMLAEKIEWGYVRSQNSWVVVEWSTDAAPKMSVSYTMTGWHKTVAERYAEWARDREPPLFGAHPDARLMDLAATLGPPAEVTCLDIGAGTGRNAIPLALAGHPVDALEPAPALADRLEEAARNASVDVRVVRGNYFDRAFKLPRDGYRLVVAAETCSHWRGLEALRLHFERLSELLAPGGVGLFNMFVAWPGYRPDALAIEFSQSSWCPIYTRKEVEECSAGLPLELVSDDLASEYEEAHLAPDAWPPTGWYVNWAGGRDMCDLPPEQNAMALRWLAYRRV